MTSQEWAEIPEHQPQDKMGKQQTAVEWLMQAIKDKSEIIYKHIAEDGFFEAAKHMEKERIMGAYINGQVDDFKHRAGIGEKPNKENYYNQTYGQ